MLFTGEIDSEFVSKHEFGNEWLPSTSDVYFVPGSRLTGLARLSCNREVDFCCV